MPAARSLAPKYCLHKPSGRAYLRIRGRVRYIGKYNSPESLEAYGRLVAELAAQGDTPVADTSVPASITVVELADAYWQFCAGYYRKKDGTPSDWLRHIHLVLHTHLAGLYGRTPAPEFGPKAFKAIRQGMVEAGCSRPYINKLMPIIIRAFKWAAAEELIPAGIYHALRTVEGLRKGRTTAREPAPVQPVDDAVIEATLPHLPLVVIDMVRFQRLTGCRPGEVCQLRPGDIDRSEEVWAYRPASHKTEHRGKERVIFIGPKAQAVLRPYLLRAADTFCFSPVDSEIKRHREMRSRRKTRVQPSQRNRRKPRPKRQPADHYTKDSYGRAVRRGINKANKTILKEATAAGQSDPKLLPRWHPNQLRHTRATDIRRTYGLEAAQVILGHAKADVTQIYAERDHALAADIMRQIG
jgi:integrase